MPSPSDESHSELSPKTDNILQSPTMRLASLSGSTSVLENSGRVGTFVQERLCLAGGALVTRRETRR
jgi:hypothetical protein